MKRLFFLWIASLTIGSAADAALVTGFFGFSQTADTGLYNDDPGRNDDNVNFAFNTLNTIELTRSFDAGDGVTFDATLTLQGLTRDNLGPRNLANGNLGIGVVGNGNAEVNGGEQLFATMSVSSVSGGTVTFDGFTGGRLSTFGDGVARIHNIANDELVLLDSANSTGSFGELDFATNLGEGTLGLRMRSFPAGELDPTETQYRLRWLDAQFTTAATAIPEPSSFAMIAIGGCRLLFRRRRIVA
ncbi:MAG: hypothetical protein AAF745_14965 [Planctomycetota bacterium]